MVVCCALSGLSHNARCGPRALPWAHMFLPLWGDVLTDVRHKADFTFSSRRCLKGRYKPSSPRTCRSSRPIRWRHKVVTPLQGSCVVVFCSPGRCPGLPCRCPVGANNGRTRTEGANNERTRGADRTHGEDRSQATRVEQPGRQPVDRWQNKNEAPVGSGRVATVVK